MLPEQSFINRFGSSEKNRAIIHLSGETPRRHGRIFRIARYFPRNTVASNFVWCASSFAGCLRQPIRILAFPSKSNCLSRLENRVINPAHWWLPFREHANSWIRTKFFIMNSVSNSLLKFDRSTVSYSLCIEVIRWNVINRINKFDWISLGSIE
jgi:hypothetical protein